MTDLERRRVSQCLGIAVISGPLIPIPAIANSAAESSGGTKSAARPLKKPLVDDKTTTAKALSYMESSDKSHQTCSNCAVFEGYADAESGECPLFVAHRVGAKAWCSAWTEKA